ncbi:NADH-quinone oxidoreductase subunit NuoG [uncultured Ferrovibrio sp.]|jgi:NADH-quinone oxidoreductase subunit G|uniref:NADH-quinone oxidoreductase subunit NuoG n=1 Tax=uncultured Ferrovibrio sp. TaxID=1576913 RepID=UPI00262D2A9D|nr:NADH-quinone oxidoreductase subunit NuoG [uncultured Ferrovibrio sp.]
MPTLTIDGIEVTVEPGSTVLQACEAAGKEIPRFCYHERLSIAGNCRMCLVEQEKAPKPIASCAMPAADGMVIKTDTPMVKKAREGVMEFLLINHPLDCPICDQGGECDLQDQAMGYGRGTSRYDENKRAVKDKYMGPLIETVMTRCIHCTRCIRFAQEIAGVPELGAIGRGEDMQITTYLEQALTSELSGNVIDLCPVGALTSKPYAFTARAWELRKTESVDVMDAVGANIRIDVRGREVMRVLPRLNEEVNEEWLSDKSRFAYDGLKHRRLDRPYVRKDDKLQEASWGEAFAAIANALQGLNGSQIAAIAGDLACAESVMALKDLMGKLGSPNLDCRQDGAKIDPATRAGYLFNSGIAGIEEADAILLVGTNPRREAALINARIRKRYLRGNVKIGLIGEQVPLTYRVDYLGAGPSTLKDIAEGKHAFADVLKSAQRPMLIIGQGALTRADGAAILALARQVAENCGLVKDGWNGFNMLHTAASRVGALDLGFVPGEGGRDVAAIQAGAISGAVKFVYLLGADELDTSAFGSAFVVYQGSHGDAGAKRADVILPGAAYPEKDATWVNTEGRVQLGRRAAVPPGEAREDWAIIRALSDVLGQTLPYDNLGQLRRRMLEAAPHFAAVDKLTPAAWGSFGTPGSITDAPFKSPIDDFYLTNPIARASAVMAECSAIARGETTPKTGTHD